MLHWMLVNGQPTPTEDREKWGVWYETSGDERRLARTVVCEGVEVSTVFLGMDHSFGGWETLVFGGVLDGEMDRYSSRENAEAGHAAVVKRVEEAESCDS